MVSTIIEKTWQQMVKNEKRAKIAKTNIPKKQLKEKYSTVKLENFENRPKNVGNEISIKHTLHFCRIELLFPK